MKLCHTPPMILALAAVMAAGGPPASIPQHTPPASQHAHPPAAQQQADTTPAFQVRRTGAGRPLILIPGLLSGGAVWDATVAEFARDHDVHVLTLAGFAGAPPTAADPFLAATRDAIIDYIREQRLERPVLIGHSLGAFLSLWIAATSPDLTGPVVAVDGVPFLSALGDTSMTAERATSQADAVRAIFAGMNSDALAAQTRMALASQAGDTAWHAVGARWGATSDPATAGRAVAELMTTDIRNDVARITSPVLLLMAAHGMPPALRETMLQRYGAQLGAVRDARVVAADSARHFIMLDDPAFLHATVRAFLAGR